MADYSSSDLPKSKMGPARLSPFQQAFREARAAGKKDFTFNGKRYSTELAKPKAEAAPKAPAGPRRDMAAEAKGAETLERMKSLPGTRSNEEMRDEAKGRTLAALGAAATLAGGPLARMAMGRAASEGAKRITPMLATSRNAGTGKFRNTQGSLKESTEAAVKSRPGPEMGAGAKSGRAASESGRVEPMLSTSRASDSGKFRKSDVSLKEATEAAKKDRIEPTFKKGGSVKGGGCEARSKKTRYV